MPSESVEVIIPVSFMTFDADAVSCVIERIRDHTYFDGSRFVAASESEPMPILGLARIGESAMFAADVRAPMDVITAGLYRIIYMDSGRDYNPIGFMYWDVMETPIDMMEVDIWTNVGIRWVYVTDRDPFSGGGEQP